MIEQKKYINFIKMYSKAYLVLRKEKSNTEVGRSSVVKSEKRSGAVRRDTIELKWRVEKFHVYSITFWAKAVLQPKKTPKGCSCHIVI